MPQTAEPTPASERGTEAAESALDLGESAVELSSDSNDEQKGCLLRFTVATLA